MAEIVERIHPKHDERTEEVDVSSVFVLLPGDVVLPGDGVSEYPRVRRTIKDDVEGSVTLKLTEAEASLIRAVLARVNGHGDEALWQAAGDVYDLLGEAELQTDYIRISRPGEANSITVAYGTDDRPRA